MRGEQRLPQGICLVAGDRGRRARRIPLASSGRFDVDADEPEETVEERLGHVNAANAFERDRANGPAEHPECSSRRPPATR